MTVVHQKNTAFFFFFFFQKEEGLVKLRNNKVLLNFVPISADTVIRNGVSSVLVRFSAFVFSNWSNKMSAIFILSFSYRVTLVHLCRKKIRQK